MPEIAASKELLYRYLREFLTPQRLKRLDSVVARRTRRIAVVLDDIGDSHNTNAVMRSCDAFGAQDLHLIEVNNRFEVEKRVVRGSHLWLTLHRYRSSTPREECLFALKSQGYRIVATSPHADAVTPRMLPLDRPIAIVLGNEKVGVSETVLAAADEHLLIPMCGFTESLNVSVAAAVCLEQLTARLRESNVDWQLSTDEQNQLLFDWVRKSVPHLEAIEKRFFRDQQRRANPLALGAATCSGEYDLLEAQGSPEEDAALGESERAATPRS